MTNTCLASFNHHFHSYKLFDKSTNRYDNHFIC